MTTTHFAGPLEVGVAPALGRPVEMQVLSLVPTAAASTALTMTLPACRIVRVTQRTTTAYTGNTVTVAVGTTVGGVDIVAAATIKTKANRVMTLVDASADILAAFAGGVVYVTIAQTATETAVGAGELMVEFMRTGDA